MPNKNTKRIVAESDPCLPDPSMIKVELEKLFAPLRQSITSSVVEPKIGENPPFLKSSQSSLEGIGFNRARQYVIASDPDFSGYDGLYARHELVELRCCVKLLNAQIRLLKQDDHQADAVRLMLFCYLHIIEADYPYALIYNALCFSHNKDPLWNFLDLADGEDEKQKNKRRKKLQHPECKYEYIKQEFYKTSDDLFLPLDRLYKSHIRNAVAHSHFYVDQNSGMIFITADYSSISRDKKPSKIEGTSCLCYTREAIELIYKGACVYWKCANELYQIFENRDRMY